MKIGRQNIDKVFRQVFEDLVKHKAPLEKFEDAVELRKELLKGERRK